MSSILRRLAKGHQTLGIEITDSRVKICEFQQKGKNNIQVLNYTSVEIPGGAVDDGRVADVGMLQQALRQALDSRRFSTSCVNFAIPSQTVMVRNLKLPNVAPKELKKLVQFEMNHNLNLAIDDAHYDFIKLPYTAPSKASTGAEENGLCNVLVVAAPMSILQQYKSLFEQAGLAPYSFEIKSFSILRMIEWSKVPCKDVQLVVNVNETNSEITIIAEGSFQLTHNVQVSFEAAPPDQAAAGNDWLHPHSSPEQAFQSGVNELVEELERLMNFYNYTLNGAKKPFHSVLLAGDLPDMDKLRTLMEDGMGRSVVLLDWKSLLVEGDASEWSSSTYAVPLGLALRGRQL